MGSFTGLNNTVARYEMRMVGGTPTLYYNGVSFKTSPIVSINPSYIGFGSSFNAYGYNAYGYSTLDNLIIGETDHHIVGAIPTNWSIHNDFINPASDGVYAWNPTTSAWVLKNSGFFYIDADKEFGSIADPEPEVLQISNMATGTVVNSTTVTQTHNLVAYSVAQFLATPGVTAGQYSVGFEGSAVRDYFWVIENGGWITFPKSTYNIGDTAPMTWHLTASYINLADYTYTYEITDVYGNVKASGITATTGTDTDGTVQITFSSPTYSQGVYYTQMIATSKLDATRHVLGYSAITLTDHVQFSGYVIDAETLLPISTTNVSITQAGYVSNTFSGPDGNYTSNASFITGYPMAFNITKAGYAQYTNTFTPLAGSSKSLNFTLLSLTPTFSGISIGGIVRDNVYGNPVDAATVVVQNGTTSTTLTNRAGFYRVDSLVYGTLYDVWSSKTGFGNSTVAQKTARGS
jgi:hypothetical protein